MWAGGDGGSEKATFLHMGEGGSKGLVHVAKNVLRLVVTQFARMNSNAI